MNVWELIEHQSCKKSLSASDGNVWDIAGVPSTNVNEAKQLERVDGDIWSFINAPKCSETLPRIESRQEIDGDIWSFMSPDMKTSKPPPGYAKLLSDGRGLTEVERAVFRKMAWWSRATTKRGAKVFVLAPSDSIRGMDMQRLLVYSLSIMHEHVVTEDQRFAIVWVQLSEQRVWPLSAMQLKASLHEMYTKNLEVMHVVHPSWTLRFLELALLPFAENAFWEKFQVHERLEFLEDYVDLKALELPREFYEFDRYLDREAELLQRQAEWALHNPHHHLVSQFGALEYL